MATIAQNDFQNDSNFINKSTNVGAEGLTDAIKGSQKRTWEYSGQLGHRVIVDVAPGAEREPVAPIFRTSNSSYGSHQIDPNLPFQYPPRSMVDSLKSAPQYGIDGRFTQHLLTAGMYADQGLHISVPKSRVQPHPTCWMSQKFSNGSV
mmetsp:Transcript_22232/g.36834  ORF Transcript_22232/g.36834 Transcript_22232/m.36834 type:complete len:149 (-) Transcript_22232:148-594(-)